MFKDETEWQLNTKVFREIFTNFGQPDIDIFASRLNAQLPRFMSWHPDPDAKAVDAFAADWRTLNFYASPPFCLIARCLQNITFDEEEGIMVVPNWRTQPWFARLRQMLVGEPLQLRNNKNLLLQPLSGELHPLHNQLSRLYSRLSGRAPVPQHPRRDHQSYRSKLERLHTNTIWLLPTEVAAFLQRTTSQSV